MNKRTTLGTIAILGFLSASGFLLFGRRESKIELGPYQALGSVAAEETIKLTGPTNRIVLVAQDTRGLDMPALAAQLESFQSAARKNAGVTIEVESIAMDAMTMMSAGGRIPAEEFFKIVEKHPKAGAIVLFLGFPQLANRDLEVLKQRVAKLVIVAGYRVEYQDLLRRRIVDLAIVPRFDALPETARKPRTLRDWFEQEYVILSPETAAALPR